MSNEQPVTPGDIGMYLSVLHQAEQATTAERWEQALVLWEQVAMLNPVSGAHWLQLGYAQMHAQQDHAAIASLTRALELGGAFPPPGDYEASFPWRIAYQIACCYARIGEQHHALDWLERALALGYRARAALADDPAFSTLAHDPRFRMLLGLADAPAGNRDDGWRQDISWLATEIKRLHYRPFRHISEPAFDELVQQLYTSVPDLGNPQLFVGLMKLMRQLGDGHSRAVIWQERPEFQSVPLIWYWFTEGLFIIATAPGYESLLGAQVTHVGDRLVAEVLAELDAIISQDNAIWPRMMAPYFLHQPYLLNGLGLAPDPATLQLTIRDATGQIQTVILPAEHAPIHTPYGFGAPEEWSSIPRNAGGEVPLYLRDSKNYWYEQIPEQQAIYVQYKRVRDESDQSFAAFCQELFVLIDQQPVEKLIIDLRRNTGGNTFLHRPLLLGLLQRPQINQRGKLFVMIGRNTFSAAMNCATLLERYTNAIFAGEPTGASPNFTGETTLITLPYTQLQVSISDMYWQTSWPNDHRSWIAPHIYIPPTFAAYTANRDPVLEAILEYREEP